MSRFICQPLFREFVLVFMMVNQKKKLPSGNNPLRKIIIEKGKKKATRKYACGSKNCNFSTLDYNELCTHRTGQHFCDECHCKCANKGTHKCKKQKEPPPLPLLDVKDTVFTEQAKALKGATVSLIHNYAVHTVELRVALELVYDDLYRLLQKYVYGYKGIRVKFTFKLDVTEIKTGDRRSRFYQSLYTRITNQSFIGEVVLANLDYIEKTVIMLTQGGSGIKVEGVQALQVDIVAYQAVYPRGSRGRFTLPVCLRNRRGLLNIHSEDNCFMLCILAAFYADMIKLKKYPTLTQKQMNHAQKCALKTKLQIPRNYKHIIKWVKERKLIDFTGFEGTFDLNNIEDFENRNKISINIYEVDAETNNVKINRFTRSAYNKHVNLLLVQNGENAHLILIQNTSAFFGQQGYHKAKFCPYCGLRYNKQDHLQVCKVTQQTGFRFVKDENKFFRFRDLHKLLPPPFRIYTDLLYVQSGDMETNALSVAGYGIVVCGPSGEIVTSQFYVGPDAMDAYLNLVFSLADLLSDYIKHEHLPIPNMTTEEKQVFDSKTHCEVCLQPFTTRNPKTRHHSHHIRNYPVQAVCQRDNLQIKAKSYIPMISHTHQKLGNHMILQNIRAKHNKQIFIVPKSNESFMSITFDKKLRLVDGRSLLDFPLQDLIKMRVEMDDMTTIQPFYEELPAEVLHTPFYFPHLWFDSMEKLRESKLPSYKEYVDVLVEHEVGELDYRKMQQMYTLTNCSSFKDFCLLYLKTRVLQLGAVMEEFGKWGLDTFQLSPLQEISLAGYGLTLATFHANAPFEIPTDPDIVQRILKNIRGGISHLSQRVVTANCERLGFQNVKDDERCEILIADFNSLYQYCMLQPLPFKNYKMLSPEEMVKVDIYSLKQDQGFGYVFFVDLECPKEIMEKTADFPLCATKHLLNHKFMAENGNLLNKECFPSSNQDMGVHQLILSQLPKIDQGIYYKNLQMYLRHGLRITKIHAILQFEEKPYLHGFISKNLNIRRTSESKLYQKISKGLGNNIFGKFLSVGNTTNVEIINTYPQAIRSFRKHNFKDVRIVSSDLTIGYFDKSAMYIDKNILLSFVVLELSKLKLYEVIYDVLKPKFGSRMYVCAVETDNFVIRVSDPHKTFLDDLADIRHIFDFSTLPPHHPLYDKSRAQEPGLLKIEHPYALQFVGIRPKLYSILNKCQKCSLASCTDGDLECDQCLNTNVSKGGPKRNKTPHSTYLLAAMNQYEQCANYLSLQTRNQTVSIHPIKRKLFAINNRQRQWVNPNFSVPFGYVGPYK